MEYRIDGEIAQTAHLLPADGEWMWASRGALVSYTDGIDWTLRVPGGLGGALRRSLSGEGIALARIEARGEGERLVLGAKHPGHIAVWDLSDGPVVTTRGAFLAAWGEDLDIAVTVARRAGAALFGGAGLFLQRVSGRGRVLIHGSGDFNQEELADGESITVSTGNLAAFSDGVDYDIRSVGGVRKALFGREGLFMTRLSGPGRVLVQTLTRKGTSEGAPPT